MSLSHHRFNSIAFKESFNIAATREIFKAQPGLTDPRNTMYSNIGNDGAFFVFNFGAAAFWNVEKELQKREIDRLTTVSPAQTTIERPYEDFIVEENPEAKPHVEFSKLVIDKLTPERAELVAYTVAQSAAMDYYETLIETIWDEVNVMATTRRTQSKVAFWPEKFYRKIWHVVAMRNGIVGILHLLDRPNLVWEDRLMDSLYGDLREIFDLSERLEAVQHKLDTIQDTLELLIDSARDSRLFVVEVLIVVLISFEIIMNFFK